MLKIELSGDITRGEATAALAAILALHPDVEVPGNVTLSVGDVTVSGSAAAIEALNGGPPAPGGEVIPAAVFQSTAAIPAPPSGDAAQNAEPPPPPPQTSGSVADASTGSPPPPPAAPSPAPSAGVELDVQGLPWDGRIHAETKAKNKDGTWRAKRNLDPALKATVEAELRQVLAAPAPAAAPPPPAPAPAAPAAPPAPPAPAAAPPPPAAPAPAVPAAPAVPPAPAPGGDPNAAQLFAGAMRKATSLQQAGKLTVDDLATICGGMGLTAVRDLIHRPDLVATFEAQLSAYELS